MDFRKKYCLLILFFCTGCVGPTTPFGAINDFLPQDTDISEGKDTLNSPVKISFLPQRQVLHDKNNFLVEITDKEKIPEAEDIHLFYNSIDVTGPFLAHSEIKKSTKDKKLQINFNDLRLKADRDTSIKLVYGSKTLSYASSFQPPTCDLLASNEVRFIKGFQPPNEYLSWARDSAQKTKINPSFLTAIVAQESGFNPKAVSPAKALGLTQITPVAEEQIMANNKNWPRRDISSLSYIELKSQVLNGDLNEKTDWRLSPRYSIEGGAEYIQYLRGYWSQSENLELLKKLKGDSELNLSRVILASYNSGPARVKASIQNNGEKWLEEDNLKEARKYIRLVFSYCYHFSERS